MTRINCVPVSELTDPHLRGEWKEISRVLTQARLPNPREKWPQTYRMGTGHVRFFYTHLTYIIRRYEELWHEMIRRGYMASFDMMASIVAQANRWYGQCPKYWNDWEPTKEAMAVNRARIKERLDSGP